MKRAVLAVVSTVAALIMLLSFKTHSLGIPVPPPAAVSGTGSTSGSSGTVAKGAGHGGSQTVTGDAAYTRYGPVQVQIKVSRGAVTDVSAVSYPQGNSQDAQINSYAIPALNSEALSAGSAHIDMISGATFTSSGYISSLQSALDKAGL
jgi:uncharacterized protein with FMN-binding domain